MKFLFTFFSSPKKIRNIYFLKPLILLIFVLFVVPYASSANNPDFKLQDLDTRKYGDGHSLGFSGTNTSENGFIMLGRYDSYISDLYIVKIDANGSVIWENTYGGAKSEYPGVQNGIIETPDKGFVITGSSSSYNPANDPLLWVLKLDTTGKMIWHRSFENADVGNSVIETIDGGLAICGFHDYGVSNSGPFLIKLDNLGNKEWDISLVGGGCDDVIQLSNGHFYLTGSDGNDDGWLAKINSSGSELWQKSFAGPDIDNFHSLTEAGDGLILAGKSCCVNRGDAWVVKVDYDGNKFWNMTFGGQKVDQFSDVFVLENGNLIFGGSSQSYRRTDENDYSYDFWFVKTNSNGVAIENKTWGDGNNALAFNIVSNNGEYYLIGWTSEFSDTYVWIVNSNSPIQEPQSSTSPPDQSSNTLISSSNPSSSSITSTNIEFEIVTLFSVLIMISITKRRNNN
jgi:hypothetical protein